jgi:tetratricopeptide (TPR) repeat protein
VTDRTTEVAECRRLARRTVELGRDDAVSLANAGMALFFVAGELDDGEALLEQALALNQNLAWVWHFSALAKAYLGDPQTAIEHAARAMRLSPQDPQTFAMQMATAWGRFFLGRDEEASRWAEAALRQQPNFLISACVAAAGAANAGHTAGAERGVPLARARPHAAPRQPARTRSPPPPGGFRTVRRGVTARRAARVRPAGPIF